MNSNKLTFLTKLFLDMMFYAGILLCLILPWAIKYLGRTFPEYLSYYAAMITIYELAGIMGLTIVQKLRKIFQTVLNHDCFIYENVKGLKAMGICSFVIVVLMTIRVMFILNLSTLVLILVFFLAGMFSFVLAQVFKTAVTYKHENDLTI